MTSKGWRFEYVNPAFARLVGKPIEDLIGKSMDNIVIPEDLPTLTQMRSKRLAGETNTCGLRLRRSDAEVVYVHATGAPRWLGDKVIGSIHGDENYIKSKLNFLLITCAHSYSISSALSLSLS